MILRAISRNYAVVHALSAPFENSLKSLCLPSNPQLHPLIANFRVFSFPVCDCVFAENENVKFHSLIKQVLGEVNSGCNVECRKNDF